MNEKMVYLYIYCYLITNPPKSCSQSFYLSIYYIWNVHFRERAPNIVCIWLFGDAPL